MAKDKNTRELLRVGAPCKVATLQAMLAALDPADLTHATVSHQAHAFVVTAPLVSLLDKPTDDTAGDMDHPPS